MPIRPLAALAALFLALAGCATPKGPTHPDTTWPQEKSDLPPDSSVVYGKLPNGLRYAVVQNAMPTGVGAVRLRIAAGSLEEDEDQRGLAHVLEHMAFNGSKNVPEGQMVPILERAGLAFGADTNAFTNVDETVFKLDLPKVDDDTLNTAFFLLDEIAENLTIAPDALDRERGVVLSEMREGNTYEKRYQDAAQDFLYSGTRFPTRDPIGIEEVVHNASAQRVRDFYKSYYRPERALLVFVGDAPADQIAQRVQKTFGGWRGQAPDNGDPDKGHVRPHQVTTAQFIDPDLPTVVSITTNKPAPRFTDTIQARRDRLTRNLGFSMLTRRLQRISRAKDAPFLGGSSDYTRIYDTLEASDVTLVAEAGKWKEALDAGEQELRRALQYGFTKAELDEQLAAMRAPIKAAADGATTRRSTRLADALLGTLSVRSVFTHPSTDLQRFDAFAAQVSLGDVQAAFEAAWGDKDPLIFVGAPKAVDGGPDAIKTAYLDSKATPVDAAPETKGRAFAYQSFGPPGTVATRTEEKDLGITKVRFGNNVRLNIKKTSFAKDRVSVSVRVGGGRLEMPKTLPGLESLAESTFVSAGLVAHSIDDLETLLAGENVGVDFSVNEDAFEFSAVATPEDLALQLKLFAAYVSQPGYREEALTRYRRSLDAWYESLDATPDGVEGRDVPRLLHSGDPRYGVPKEEVMSARTFAEMRKALESAFGSGAIEIGMVGDVDVDQAIKVVADSFGALPQRTAKAPVFAEARAVRFPQPNAGPVVLHHKGEKNRALALTYWPAVDDKDVQLARELTIAKEVLQLKLTDRIREKEGASYSPSAFANFSEVLPGYGYIGVAAEVEPQRLAGVFSDVDDIVAAMAAGDVTDDEIERARRPLLADIAHAYESNGYWLNLAATAQTKPQLLEEHRTQLEGFKAITRADVIAAAKRFLVKDHAFRVEITPDPKAEAPKVAASAATAAKAE
jgi:zinc protease